MRKMILFGVVMTGLLLNAGCLATSVVPLSYPEALSDTPWCRWDVTLVGLVDKRPAKTLGVMDEQTNYTAASDVAEWVSRSLYREIESRGCRCVVVSVESTDEGFVIDGEVLSVSLDKIGINQWSTHMDIRVQLSRDGEMLFGQTYSGTVERTFLLASEGPEAIMAEGLSDILKDAAVKITDAMRTAQR